MAVRELEFSRKGKRNLAQGETNEAMDKLDEVFRSNNWNYPRKVKYAKQDLQIQLQLIGYKNKDPLTNQEKYFTPFFLNQLFHMAIIAMHISIATLPILGSFFTGISCKYVKAKKG